MPKITFGGPFNWSAVGLVDQFQSNIEQTAADC